MFFTCHSFGSWSVGLGVCRLRLLLDCKIWSNCLTDVYTRLAHTFHSFGSLLSQAMVKRTVALAKYYVDKLTHCLSGSQNRLCK